jgi:hypothetical protein
MSEFKSNIVTVPLRQIMWEILEMACPNVVGDDGWNTYYIETHCIMWKVTAQKIDGEWVIKMATGEPC